MYSKENAKASVMSLPATRFLVDEQSEVFFSTSETTRAISYQARRGRLRKLGPRLYSTNLEDAPEDVARRHVWRIAAGYFPGAVVVDRTAIEFRPAADGSITLAVDRRKADVTAVPGLRLRPRVGPTEVPGDTAEQFGTDLRVSSRARAFLDNMRPSRGRAGLVSRTLSRAEMEEALDEYARNDQDALNKLRDETRALAPRLGAEKELEALDGVIGRLCGTRPGRLTTARGRARRRGTPFDHARVARLDELAGYLNGAAALQVSERQSNDTEVFAFFEAYFSNYIEGTEFDVKEAEAIVFDGAIPATRPKDARDIIGTYKLVVEASQRARVPHSADELIGILKDQHQRMLAARPEVSPGEFKAKPNHAGGYYFVDPELVEGTLREAFGFYNTLAPGFARALFAMFLVAEVHPFADGNGRIARVLMNSELTAAGMQRIIVTTAARGDYLAGLRAMSYQGWSRTLERILASIQRQTAELDFSSLEGAERQLEEARAYEYVSAFGSDRLLGLGEPMSGR